LAQAILSQDIQVEVVEAAASIPKPADH